MFSKARDARYSFQACKINVMSGKLTLVGAGPGDPELISVKGVKALADADVVLYDALVHPELLDYIKRSAKKINVGKRAGKHSYQQDEINALIVHHASQGLHVVRLKGGDPFIFARGQEELEYAVSYGIDTEAILGISSIGLPGYYGIPLTRRGINESFWVITATTRNGCLSGDIALAAQSTATAVIFMGLKKLQEITDIYTYYGKAATPLAIISKGSLPDSRIIFGTAESISRAPALAQIEAPAIIIIGDVVATNPDFYEAVRNVISQPQYQQIQL